MQVGYSIYGVKVRFRWEHPEVGRAVRELASHFALDPLGSTRSLQSDILLHVSVSEPPWKLPENAEEIGALDNETRLWRSDGMVYFGRGSALMRIDLAGGVGVGYIGSSIAASTDTLRSYCQGMYLNSLVLLLPRFRLFALHAAAVSVDGHGVLLPAGSDSGKSSLAYALVREGWSFVSDDSVLLSARAENIRALSFRRTFALDPDADRHFPELGDVGAAALAEARKRAIPLTTLRPRQAETSCVPDLIVFPRIVDQDESQVQEIGKAEALRLMLMQSTIATSDRTTAEHHLETLRRLAVQAKTYRLMSGRDLLERRDAASTLLRSLL
ncbi:MAG TPA: hypothetical protein VF190_14160 [Rhodothermales bacterium]